MDQKKPPPKGAGPPDEARRGRGAAEKAEGDKRACGDGKMETVTEQGTATEEEKPRATKQEAAGRAGTQPPRKAWGNPAATKALLFAPAPVTSGYPDEQIYAAEYECARKTYQVAASDACREMTPLEARTLWLWRSGAIRLSSPPNFTSETHTLRQRMRNLQIQRNKLFSRLFILLNPGQRLRQNGAKWHFCNVMLGMNDDLTVTDQSALAFLSTVFAFRCKADSPLVEFMFVRPEERDRWAGQKFKLPGGEVTLHATNSFNSEGKGVTYDTVAMTLLFEVRLTGGDYADPDVILVIAKAIAGDLTVHSVRAEEPTGAGFYGNQIWVITLDSTVGPAALVKIRELAVNYGNTRKFKFGVHQPRLARHPPCPCCLDDNHPRHKCPLLEQTAANVELRETVRAPRRMEIDVAEGPTLPEAPLPATEAEFHTLQAREFARLEPEIMKARAAEAAAAAAAATAELETAKAQLHKIETVKEAEKAIEETTAAETSISKATEEAARNEEGAGRSDAQAKEGATEGPNQEEGEARKQNEPGDSGDSGVNGTSGERKTKKKKGGKKDTPNLAGTSKEKEEGANKGSAPTGKTGGSSKDGADGKAAGGSTTEKADEGVEKGDTKPSTADAADKKRKEEAEAKERRNEAEAKKRRAYEDARCREEAQEKTRREEEKRVEQGKRAEETAAAAAAMQASGKGEDVASKQEDESKELGKARDESTEEVKRGRPTAKTDEEMEGEIKTGETESITKGETAEELAERAASELATALMKAMREAEAARLASEGASKARATTGETSDREDSTRGKNGGETAEGARSTEGNLTGSFEVDLEVAAAAMARATQAASQGEDNAEDSKENSKQEDELPEPTDLQRRAEKKRAARSAARKAKQRARRADMEAKAAAARYLVPGSKVTQQHEPTKSKDLLDRLMTELDTEGSETDEDDFEPMRPESALKTEVTGRAKGKRVRVDSAEDPSTVNPPTARPPTRQMRTMTAHEYVVSKTNSKFLIAARARAANKHAKEGGTKQKTQLSVARFLRAVDEVDEDVHMRTESDATRDDAAEAEKAAREAQTLTEEEWRLVRFSVFLARHGLHEVITPPNGSCLAYSCYAMKAAQLDAHEIPMTRTSVKEANFYRRNLALYIIQHFDELVGVDDYPLSEASFALLGTTEVNELTIPRIIEHLKEDARQQCDKQCDQRLWGTELHIRALVHWCKEPVYVCNVLPHIQSSTWEMAVQRYSYDKETMRVRTEQISVAETVRCLKVYYAKKVLPLMLVLRVKAGANGEIASHFNGIRTDQAHYDEWSGSKRKAADMKRRLGEVVDLINSGHLSTPQETILPKETRPQNESSSEYEPSSAESSERVEVGGAQPGDGSSGTRNVENGGQQGVIDLVTPSEQVTGGQQGVTDLLASTEQAGGKEESEKPGEKEDTRTRRKHESPTISTPEWSQDRVFTSSVDLPVSSFQQRPREALTAAQLEELLDRLKDQRPIQKKEKEFPSLAMANAANRAAFAEWKRSLRAEAPELHKMASAFHTAWDACVAVCEEVQLVLPLLRALSYAHVLLATLETGVIETIGKTFECAGRVQMLTRLAENTRISDAGRSFCLQWATAVSQLQPLAMKRRESEKQEAWGRLQQFVKQHASMPLSPETVANNVSASEWLHAVAFAVALPQHLPSDVRRLPLDRVCDEAICWLASPGHIDFTRAVGIALVNRDWDAIGALFATEEDDETSGAPQRRATDPAANCSLERQRQGPRRN